MVLSKTSLQIPYNHSKCKKPKLLKVKHKGFHQPSDKVSMLRNRNDPKKVASLVNTSQLKMIYLVGGYYTSFIKGVPCSPHIGFEMYTWKYTRWWENVERGTYKKK